MSASSSSRFLRAATPYGIFVVGGLTFFALAYKDKNSVTLPPYTVRDDLRECLVVATGGTSGIGREALRLVAERGGGRIALGSRDVTRGEEAKEYIKTNSKAAVEVLPLDTSSLVSCRVFAEAVKEKAKGRPIIFIGAAANISTDEGRELSKDGYDYDFSSNHLGLQSIVADLGPHLTKEEGSRVVIVGSKLERQGKLDVEVVRSSRGKSLRSGGRQLNQKPSPVQHYSDTKLANSLLGTHLSSLFPSVTTVVVSPGMVNTGLWRNFSAPYRAVTYPLRALALRSPEDAAEGVFYAAAAAEVEEEKGSGCIFLVDGVRGQQSEVAEDKVKAKELYEVCAELIEQKKPRTF